MIRQLEKVTNTRIALIGLITAWAVAWGKPAGDAAPSDGAAPKMGAGGDPMLLD